MTPSDSQPPFALADPLAFEEPAGARIPVVGGAVWFQGFVRGREAAALATEAARLTPEAVPAWLKGLDGFFRLVVKTPRVAFGACDPVRSYPLIWARDATGAVIVSASGPALEEALRLGSKDLDPEALAPFALSGFTIGARTIYRGVSQIGPGQVLLVDTAGGVSLHAYHQWDPWRPAEGATIEGLGALHERLIDDLIKDARGRQIFVPLSAGHDSRFIASGLREAGYDNVLTVSYGLPGNREAHTAREIARRLGYKWRFLPYSNLKASAMFHGADYAAFKAHSDSLTAIHFPQEYMALSQLFETGAIDRDTLVVNGQSGDFITGNHIQPNLADPPEDPVAAKRAVIEAMLDKHYRQWASLRTPQRLEQIGKLLSSEIDRLGLDEVGPDGLHGVYEWLEFQDRQSKYVINGQRVYDHFGLEWRLPLWDRACLDWWARAPLAAKLNQRLYRETLERMNWGGVWRDVPINPMRIRPGWLRPIRFAAKVMHAPLGRHVWRRFEKRYFDYWMGATCAYAAWPYAQVAADRRGAHNALAWHIEAYLNAKGADWKGSPFEDGRGKI